MNTYWERACQFFLRTGHVGSEGSYFVHNKNSKTVKIGILCQISVAVGHKCLSYTEDGRRTAVTLQSDEPVLERVEKLLRKDAPCFFVLSPDIRRRFVDESLPQILFVQPAVEFTLSPDQSDGQISYARDSASESIGTVMLRASSEKPLSVQPTHPDRPRSFSEMIAGWTPAEDDESFLSRLEHAISVLQEYPDGKMALTRAYERRLAAKGNGT